MATFYGSVKTAYAACILGDIGVGINLVQHNFHYYIAEKGFNGPKGVVGSEECRVGTGF